MSLLRFILAVAQVNSMIETGITQAAMMAVSCAMPSILEGPGAPARPWGHSFFSCHRLAENITDFKSFVADGVATLPPGPGLGIVVDEAKLARFQTAPPVDITA